MVRLNAKENERTISNGAHLGCRLSRDSLLAVQTIENKTFRVNCVSEMFSPDEKSRRASAGKHSAEIATDGACANDRDSRPFSSFAH